MSWRKTLEPLLRDLQASQDPTDRCCNLRLSGPGGELQCDLDDIDKLACRFRRLALHSSQLAAADARRLEEISRGLSQKLTYLLEPIRPLERDPEAGVVQSRSWPPARSPEQGTCYYELLAERGGALTLTRYAKRPGEVRRQQPICVTREVLYRLADDLVEAVS